MIAIILGTRPEIVKMSPIIKALERKRANYFILHTGQHYAPELDEIFFQELNIPQPEYNLKVRGSSHAEATGMMLVGIEKILSEKKPDIVLVEGDTNTVLAGALAASKLCIKVGHVEAGLRSYDRRMPEEINRVLTDHCSDLLFAPTDNAQKILLGEGVPAEKIFVTGNTIVDAVQDNIKRIRDSDILEKMGLDSGSYFLATVHRQENVDDVKRFGKILNGLELVSEEFKKNIIYPMHPRSKKMMRLFKLGSSRITFVNPLGFIDFLSLMSNANAVLTDSGGVQEESCILGVPCITLRDNTERPETLKVGSNVLAGTDPDSIVKKTKYMTARKKEWSNPFGDGRSGERIASITLKDGRKIFDG